MSMSEDQDETDTLLSQAARGDQEAVTRLLTIYRDRLRRMVASRLDDRLAARLDASDVVQETMLVAAESLPKFAQERPIPFYAWLRLLASQRLVDLQRRHLGAQRRTIFREQPMACMNDTTLHLLARQLLAQGPGPHSEALRQERLLNLRQTLEALAPDQQEILSLHYIEDLTLAEAAAVLQITAQAARMRHLRAIKRLRELLESDLGISRP